MRKGSTLRVRLVGCTSVLTLLDLVKAYEHVGHQRIFEGAVDIGFNLSVFLFVLKVFLFCAAYMYCWRCF